VTAAYAFIDYQAQDQITPYVIVDIASPPTGGLNLFNLCVVLSRSSVFQATHRQPHIFAKDDRLDKLDKETKLWWKKWDTTPGNLKQ
ncbi:hypothetical protein ID866_8598, partial [Astraeus odoratus]